MNIELYGFTHCTSEPNGIKIVLICIIYLRLYYIINGIHTMNSNIRASYQLARNDSIAG